MVPRQRRRTASLPDLRHPRTGGPRRTIDRPKGNDEVP